MAQDSDVARMAAALRTPSLRYRSFGNEAVRNVPAEPPQEEGENFPLLGDALAAIESLPPDATLAPDREPSPAPMRPDLPAMVIAESRDMPDAGSPPVASTYVPSPRPAPYVSPAPEPALYIPVAPPPSAPPQRSAYSPPPEMPASPAPSASVYAGSPAAVPPPAPPVPSPRPSTVGTGSQTLLQTLLAEAPARAAPADSDPIVVGRHPPQAAAPLARMATPSAGFTGEPVLPMAPPVITTRGLAPPLPPLPGPQDRGTAGTARMAGPGTGSSLLDMLVGRGDASQSAAQYPLLDALTTAMRSDLGGASSRVWPAARVEMALPELLRRIAAGVRTGRGLN